MRLAEEMILLLLNEESGYLEHIGGWNMACAVAGSEPETGLIDRI